MSKRMATVLCAARSGSTMPASTASSPARYCTAGRSVFSPVAAQTALSTHTAHQWPDVAQVHPQPARTMCTAWLLAVCHEDEDACSVVLLNSSAYTSKQLLINHTHVVSSSCKYLASHCAPADTASGPVLRRTPPPRSSSNQNTMALRRPSAVNVTSRVLVSASCGGDAITKCHASCGCDSGRKRPFASGAPAFRGANGARDQWPGMPPAVKTLMTVGLTSFDYPADYPLKCPHSEVTLWPHDDGHLRGGCGASGGGPPDPGPLPLRAECAPLQPAHAQLNTH